MKKVLKKLDLIILSLIAIIASGLTILDVSKVPLISAGHYPIITVFLLSMVALHLIVSRLSNVDFQEKTKRALETLCADSIASEYIQYNDPAHIEGELAERIKKAKTSVRDLSWKAKLSDGFYAPNRQSAHKYMDKSIAKASNRINYREIFTFPDGKRIEKLERRIKENRSGYSCRYFKEYIEIPRLQFVIVDDEYVFFFASSAGSILCSLRSKKLAKVFLSYYDAVWDKAIPIKAGPDINDDTFNEIKALKSAKTQIV